MRAVSTTCCCQVSHTSSFFRIVTDFSLLWDVSPSQLHIQCAIQFVICIVVVARLCFDVSLNSSFESLPLQDLTINLNRTSMCLSLALFLSFTVSVRSSG